MSDDETDAAIAAEQLAEAVENVSEAAVRLLDSGLNRRGLIVLLQDGTGLGKRQINDVLNALSSLADDYLTPPPAPSQGREER